MTAETNGAGPSASGLRLLVAASGSGGHIYPGLAVARAFADLRDDGTTEGIRFLGDPRRLETRLVPAHGFPLDLVETPPLRGRSPFGLAAAAARLPGSLRRTMRLLRDFRPDAVFGTGGAVSGMAALAARLVGIPSLILEPNAEPGLATKWSARAATEIAVGFEDSKRHFPGRRVFHSGIPVRADFLDLPLPEERNGDPLPVLITGGSQGATRLNRTVLEALPLLAEESPRLTLTHQTGPADLLPVRAAYERLGLGATVVPYLEDMPTAFRAAGLVVARGGAITCAELAAAGRPAVLIPAPVAGAHQQGNARTMERAGAAATLPDGAPGPDFAALLLDLRADRARRERMAEAARGVFAAPDADGGAAVRLARRLVELARTERNGSEAR